MAAAIGEGAAGEAGKMIFGWIWEQIVYLRDYKDNLDKLKNGIKDLENAKSRVLNDVNAATERLEKIEEDVESWLKSVDKEISKVKQILEDDQRASNCCCVSVIYCHNFSKRAKLESETIEGLITKSQFCRVGIPDSSLELLPCRGYQSFESREGTVESILQVLKDGDVKVAGIWGLPGVGKTMLARKVQERARAEGIFNKVALTTITDKPDLRKIQREIADLLNFKIELEESIEARASRLHNRLKLENKVLIILDDVWKQVGLDEIGIPSGGDTIVSKLPSGGDAKSSKVLSVSTTNVCKVLLTSRDKCVLLAMGACAQCCFPLAALSDQEAWELFRAKAGDVQDPTIERVAIKITRRCAGLPLLISPVATALRNKELCEWEDALEDLKKFGGEGIEAFAAIKLSYKSLKQDEKLLFLLCGQVIGSSISYLLRYAIGLDLFQQRKTLEGARKKMLKLLNDLKSKSFLLEGHNFIRMHDVIYDFVIEVASRDDFLAKLPPENLQNRWPEKHVLEDYTSISLLNCKIPELPKVLECPKLKMFIIASSQKIPESCFQRMSDLKVLHLSEMHLSSFPSSFQILESLQTLCLDHCFLGEDISMIGNLSKLKILSLAGSQFVELPRQIGQLTRLQLLDLSECRWLKVIALGVFSGLTSLEDLYMEGISVEWGSTRSNPILDELTNLPNLTTLYVQIPDVLTLSNAFFANCKAERFCIHIGDDYFDGSHAYETFNPLKVKLAESCQSVDEVKILLNRAESSCRFSIWKIRKDLQ